MKTAYQSCPRCQARSFYIADGLGHCNRCGHRERTAPTAAEVAYADLQSQFRAHLAGRPWDLERWAEMHRIVASGGA